MANTKKDRMALRKTWLARPENKRLWLTFTEALVEDNEEEQWMEYPETTIPILLDHMVEQDSVGIVFFNRPPVAVQFAEWTRVSMQRTSNAIARYLEREVWRKDQRELREVVFKGYHPRYFEDAGKAVSLMLNDNKKLLACHYDSANSMIDQYAGLEESNISNDGIEVPHLVWWAPYALDARQKQK